MSRRVAIAATVGVLQIGLAAIWMWLGAGLETGDFHAAGGDNEATMQTVSTVIGTVMGVLAAIGAFLIFVVHRPRP